MLLEVLVSGTSVGGRAGTRRRICRFSVPGMLPEIMMYGPVDFTVANVTAFNGDFFAVFADFKDALVEFDALVIPICPARGMLYMRWWGFHGPRVAIPRLVFLPLCWSLVTPQRLTGPWKPLPTVMPAMSIY
jgi:hypothetical protein